MFISNLEFDELLALKFQFPFACQSYRLDKPIWKNLILIFRAWIWNNYRLVHLGKVSPFLCFCHGYGNLLSSFNYPILQFKSILIVTPACRYLKVIGRQDLWGPPTKSMLLWSIVVGFPPGFHIVWSRALCNCLVKKINQGTDVFTHKHTELPASSLLALCVLKHVCKTLIILTGGKNNNRIKIAESGQSAVGIHPFDCKYTFIISENADRIDFLYGEGGVCEKVGSGVKWASGYYWYYIHHVNQYACGLSSFIAFFGFLLFHPLKFVNFTHLFQPSYSLGGPEKLEYLVF